MDEDEREDYMTSSLDQDMSPSLEQYNAEEGLADGDIDANASGLLEGTTLDDGKVRCVHL